MGGRLPFGRFKLFVLLALLDETFRTIVFAETPNKVAVSASEQ